MNPRRPTPSGPEPDPSTHGSAGLSRRVNYNDIGPVRDNRILDSFYKYCLERASESTCRQYINYLGRKLDRGNKWSLLAYKKLYRYLCEELENEAACRTYKKLRTKKSGIDKYVPDEETVLDAIKKAQEPYKQVYLVLLQSGLRLNEACSLLANIDKLRKTRLNGFYRIETDMERRTKKSFVAYLVQIPEKTIIKPRQVSKYAERNHLLPPKYIRKYFATQAAKLGLSDRTIDFIQGRVPEKILRKHYLDLVALADIEYQRYAEYIKELLDKVLHRIPGEKQQFTHHLR